MDPGLSAIHITLVCISILGLLLSSALISGSEVAFFSLSKKDIGELKDSTSLSNKLLIKLSDKPKHLLSTILIINNAVNICLIILISFLISKTLTIENEIIGFLIEVVLITSVLLLLGEIVPKVYATNNNKSLSKLMSIPLYYVGKTPPISWLSALLVSSTNVIEKRLTKNEENLNVEDFKQAIDLTMNKEENLEDERKILQGLIAFGNTSVKQIMCNRVDAVSIKNDTPFEEVKALVKSSGFSRIPVYEDNFDNVKGILYSKDMLAHYEKEEFDWNQLLRPAFFVPENKKISNLLKEYQSKRIHLAIVVDEYGGTSGIVTLEDVLEEIVGEIRDEYDFDDINYRKISETEYLIDAKTTLVDASRLLKLEDDYFDEVSEEVDSLAGLILESTGTIPKFKQEISYRNLSLTVESVNKRSINRIRIKIKNEASQ